MRLAVAGVLLLSLGALGGCAKYWYQEGKTFRQTQKDLTACQTEALRHADPGQARGLETYDGKLVRRGMEERGYHLVGEKELPLRVRRESSPVVGVPGVAGTVE